MLTSDQVFLLSLVLLPKDLFQKYQYYLDKLTPLVAVRWGIAIGLIILFMFRIIYLQVFFPSFSYYKRLFQGFYIVCYAVGIYYLNLFLLFLTPSIDPALEVCFHFEFLD